MIPVVLDCETSMKPMHDPFNPAAKLCYVGLSYGGKGYQDFAIEYGDEPWGEKLKQIQVQINRAEIFVGANPKFDVHWLRRYGVRLPTTMRVWDVLLAQFILDHQTCPRISLNEVAEKWGLPGKLDVVKTEYWEKGIDTPEVPAPILREYLKQDVDLTEQIYELQYAEVVRRGILPLVMLDMQDLLMLEEMEWQGNKYNSEGSMIEATVIGAEIEATIKSLNAFSPVVPKLGKNGMPSWSPDFISLLLYGGTYKTVEKEPYLFTYKDGSTKEKMHNVVKEHVLPRLTEPPKAARAKEGYWPTDEETLKNLKATGKAKKIIEYLLELRRLEKLVGTYLSGIPSKIKLSGWEDGLVHTNYIQTRAITGRLSSEQPNMQNLSDEPKKFFVSRFE